LRPDANPSLSPSGGVFVAEYFLLSGENHHANIFKMPKKITLTQAVHDQEFPRWMPVTVKLLLSPRQSQRNFLLSVKI